jgi:hypothetical protein
VSHQEHGPFASVDLARVPLELSDRLDVEFEGTAVAAELDGPGREEQFGTRELVAGDPTTDAGPLFDRYRGAVEHRLEQHRRELLDRLVVRLHRRDEAPVALLEGERHRRVEKVAQVGWHVPDRDVEDRGQRDRERVLLAGREDEPPLAEDDPPPRRLAAGRGLGVERANEVGDD